MLRIFFAILIVGICFSASTRPLSAGPDPCCGTGGGGGGGGGGGSAGGGSGGK